MSASRPFFKLISNTNIISEEAVTRKRVLERDLLQAGWVKIEGAGSKHDKFRKDGHTIAVPRHREIKEATAKAIRKQAGLG